ncbi:hypothetical protein [Natrialba taiwanensis]|uniref:DUF8053 domain-containing protein n=1 Tax=Natrialba taiwanensis DSM 12281 TaxID=1230458 RepID=L9ZX14_9EURY|nr:hypothetical protein [Natrialba taiwanensis]ELY90884.1 hypothetical protein C484_11691 [Natrialba taiwanensis DSM 12281]
MALNKLRKLDQNSLGVTLPKDDLRVEGLLNENGELRDEHHIHIRHVNEGEWKLELIR